MQISKLGWVALQALREAQRLSDISNDGKTQEEHYV